MERDSINSIIIQHHYDKLMTSCLEYFLDLALFCNVLHCELAYNMITCSWRRWPSTMHFGSSYGLIWFSTIYWCKTKALSISLILVDLSCCPHCLRQDLILLRFCPPLVGYDSAAVPPMPSWHLMVLAGYHKTPVAVDNTNSGIATHYNTITLQCCHSLAVVGILSPLQFLINCWFYHVLGCKNVKICRNNWLNGSIPCMHIYTPYHWCLSACPTPRIIGQNNQIRSWKTIQNLYNTRLL